MTDIMKKHQKVLFGILLMAEIALMVYMTWQYGAQWLDSDDSAELILASREGGILSKNWYYSTELRVLNTQLVMAPLFCLFSDWRVVRTVGTGILLVILLLSFFFLCRSLKLGKKLIFFVPLIVWPFSREYIQFVLYGLFYIPHLVIIFLTLALCLYNSPRLNSLRNFVLVLISFIAGLGGIRLVVVCYLPLLAATLTSLFPCIRSNNLITKSFLFRSLFAAAAAVAGFFVNCKILVQSYSFVNMVPGHLGLPNWEKLLPIIKSVPRMMGAITPNRSIIIIFLVLLLCLVIALMLLRFFKHWRSLHQETQVLLLYFLFSFTITVVAPVVSTQSWSNRYMLLPGIGFIVILAAYIDHFESTGSIRKILCIFILAAELCSGINQYYCFASTKQLPEKNLAFSYILNSGLRFGFGDWDTSDVLTELSNGRIHICKIGNFKHMDAWYWLMEKDFQKYAQGKPVFLILANKRFSYHGGVPHIWGRWEKKDLTYLDSGKVVFQDQDYTVWRYESYEQLEALVGKTF